MNSLPKISVVTITYGHQDYITETLDGVFMQQYDGPIEFIIANDNSPDNTDEVIKGYLATRQIPANFEVKYTKHSKNLGMIPNFKWALGQAEGKYIAFCEGDDYWSEVSKLSKQVECLEKNEDIACCGCYVTIERFGKMDEPVKSYNEEESSLKNLVFKLPFPTLTMMLRKKYIENFINYNVRFGDVDLFMYIGQFGKFQKLPFIGGVYRFHGKGVVSGGNRSKLLKGILEAKIQANSTLSLHLECGIRKQLRRQFFNEIKSLRFFYRSDFDLKNSLILIWFCVKKYFSI